ncbi:MAG TPA: hypothetical protein PL070_08630 [Flavobacteriales bacterium]|nr:hypothetical protein [Flavobacteriales bacterium]
MTRRSKILAGVGIGLAALFFIASLTTTDEDRARWAKEDAERKAAEMCNTDGAFAAAQMVVRSRLKAPDSAEFPIPSEAVISQDSLGNYAVASWVTSQNAFGVQLRSNFVAVVACDGSSGRWREVSVSIFE